MANGQVADTPQAATAAPLGLPPSLPPSPCDCDTDPIAGLKRLFVDYFQGLGMAAGRDPATRPVFLRLHGVTHGTFEIKPDLPEALRVGLFGRGGSYATWVRFSSDIQPGSPDVGGTMGAALKLFGVAGKKVLYQDADAPTHDFILQNHDVFFVDNATEMCRFTCDSLHGRDAEYIKEHPVTGQVLSDMEKTVPSVLETPYWSVLPFKFGDRYAKYKLVPVDVPGADQAADYDDPFYLRADLAARLRKGPARLHFMVQLQTNDKDMPLDQATVRWSEDASEPVHVATLTLPAQDVESRGQPTYGDNLSFSTWRALPEHAPVGSLAEARKIVYQASADNRRNVNGTPLGEPATARPGEYEAGVPYPAAKDTRIVRAAIHPAIGVARVGNSESGYFVGPQVTDPPPQAPGFYRDEKGALKRQAAEFRIYGYNAAGDVVRELTAGTADIEWSVHLANTKAAWYQWQIAMDIPESSATTLPRRNKAATDRGALVIDAGATTVGGPGKRVECKGSFLGTDVLIGELLTDKAGRLLVLAGRGVSTSPTKSPIYTGSFGNADGWQDDVADGPVTAAVQIEGRQIPVEPAWVVSAPPNYAPQLKGVRTLYDLLFDLFVRAGWLQAPATVSFRQDVLPLLRRLSGLQWVNAGFATRFGADGPFDFDNPELLAALNAKVSDKKLFDPNKELRRQIFNSFRPPEGKDNNLLPWPWLYGDADAAPQPSPRENAAITATQWQRLRKWADGDFSDDLSESVKTPRSISDVPLAEQPATLDRAALDFCLADAFHPGCEVTWPIRHLTMYASSFRIRQRPRSTPEKDYGGALTQAAILAPDGPLFEQGPGGLTRWMCVPWQADTAWCRAGYDDQYDPFLPSFWPARVPNQVLSSVDYDVVVDTASKPEQRDNAFRDRTNWFEPLGHDRDPAMAMDAMVKVFGSMGVLEVRPGPTDGAPFPKQMMVASYGPDVAAAALQPMALAPGAAVRPTAARGANFASSEEAQLAPRPVQHTKK